MMQRVATLYRSSVGKKILMSVTGIVLFGFIVLHMVGNLKVLLGPEELNAYAVFLRTVGYPAVPNQTVLWAVRLVLLFCVSVHVVAALQTWAQSRAARKHGYGRNKDLSFTWASRTMRWGGVTILVFVVYHLLHFTTGTLHPSFIEGDVYRNFVFAFENPLILLIYVVAQAALGLHQGASPVSSPVSASPLSASAVSPVSSPPSSRSRGRRRLRSAPGRPADAGRGC